LKTGQQQEHVSASEVVKALDDFIIPKSMWPEGLVAAADFGEKYDREANQIMNTVKIDFLAMAKDSNTLNTQKTYYVYTTGHHHTNSAHALCLRTYKNGSGQLMGVLPHPLQGRLHRLADAAFFNIQFDTKHSEPSSWPCSFKVDIYDP